MAGRCLSACRVECGRHRQVNFLLGHLRKTMLEYRQVEAEIRDLKTLQRGEVIITTMAGLASGIISTAALNFCARHPQMKVSIRIMFKKDMVEAVASGDADLGLGFNLPPSSPLNCLWDMDTSLGAVISTKHALAQMESISLGQCTSYPLIFADQSMSIHHIVINTFVDAGLTVEPAFRTNSIETMKRIAAATESIAFLSKFDIAEDTARALTYRPIRERPFSKNALSLVRREKPGRGLAELAFRRRNYRYIGDHE